MRLFRANQRPPATPDAKAHGVWQRLSRRGGRSPRPTLMPLLLALALVPNACDAGPNDAARDSVTVKLPPARPYVPGPGFSFQETGQSDSK
jgi:hypothetical protein